MDPLGYSDTAFGDSVYPLQFPEINSCNPAVAMMWILWFKVILCGRPHYSSTQKCSRFGQLHDKSNTNGSSRVTTLIAPHG